MHGVVTHTFNVSTQEAEERSLYEFKIVRVPVSQGAHGKTLSQINDKTLAHLESRTKP